MFGKSGAFGLSTVAAGLVIGPALSWVDCISRMVLAHISRMVLDHI